MSLIRFSLILIAPFFAGAVVPWLSPEATGRVALGVIVWASCCVLFVAGFNAGQYAQLPSARAKLHIISSIAVACLALAALFALAIKASLASLIINMFAIVAGHKLLAVTPVWLAMPATTATLLGRLIWVAIGCLLMLAMSVYRYQLAPLS